MLIGVSITVSGCDKTSQVENADKKPAATAVIKEKEADRSVNQSVEDAMIKIPPEMREVYQRAFVCEVEREKSKANPKAINVTAEYVNSLMTRLKADPSIAKC